ncbi:MAG: transporter substrate-binding domain-containing protein [Arcobacter sp.]|nr:transporter substrate-binding domain-containing protein [Arcobacter sp.]
MKISVYTLCLFMFFSSILSANDKYDFTKEEKDYIKQSRELVVTMSPYFRPFSFKTKKKNLGFTNELLKEIEKVSGLRFHIRYDKWAEVFDKLQENQVDIIANVSKTPQRDKFLIVTKSYYDIPIYIFGLKKGKRNIKTLKGKTLAVGHNYYFQKRLEKKGIKIFNIDSSLKKSKAVLSGKADYFLSSYIAGKNAIDKTVFTPIKTKEDYSFMLKEDLRLALRKNDKILRSILDKSLNKIPKSTYKKLKQKWINNYYKNQKVNFTREELEFIKKNPTITYSEVNWEPLSIIENNTMKGIMGDYLDYISLVSGLKFKFIPSKTWKEVLEKLKNREIDLTPGATLDLKEQNLGLMSDVYNEYPFVIVTNEKYRYFKNLSELKDKIITVPKYYSSYYLLKKNYPNIKLITAENIEESLLLVKEGKADAFVGHIATSLYYISKLSLDSLRVAGTTRFTIQHSTLINKDKPILKSIIDKSLNSISEEEKEAIYYNWIQPTILKKETDYTLLFIVSFIFLTILLIIMYKQAVLKKSHKGIESIINSMMESLIIIKDHQCIEVNDSALKLFKYKSKKEMIGKDLSEFISHKYIETVKSTIYENPIEIAIIDSNKENIKVLFKSSELKLVDKKVKLLSVIDISEIKHKESLLIEQSKMAALGEMIGHIAHQWRQPLSLITSIITSWKVYEQTGDLEKEKVLEDSDVILSNANYLSQTIDDFTSFTKEQNLTLDYEIKELIDSLVKLVNPSILEENITMIVENDINKKVKGNQNEILQALINIVNNAIDALKDQRRERILFITVSENKDHITVEIKDNAGGIDEKIIHKIFEPYFTTKHESKGTGLGLYIVYSIIEKLHYKLEVKNEEYAYKKQSYRGAKFTITI